MNERKIKLKEISTLVFLGLNAWLDIKKKEISLMVTAVFAVTGVLWSFYCGRSLTQVLFPLGTGLVFLLLSLITRGAVGMGDVWILLALGLMLGTEEFIWTLCLGMVLAGAWALILLVIFRKKRHTEFPFVPFLLAGYVGGLALW